MPGVAGVHDAKRARGAQSQRRAGGYLAHLAWLEGFPIAGGWHRLDTGEPIALAGALISRTRRAAQTALRDHRDALAALVGDVERWWMLVDHVLRWCSRAAAPADASARRPAQRAPAVRAPGVAAPGLDLLDHAPPRVARQARAIRDPGLRAAAIAAGVAWANQPARLARAIAWLAGRDALIDDVATTLALAQLAEHAGPDGAAGIAALLALLAIDAPDAASARPALANLEHRLRGRTVAVPADAPRSGVRVRAWLAQLVRHAPAVQRRTLAVLAAIDAAAVLAPWQAWERGHADRRARIQAFAERAPERDATPAERRNRERVLASRAQIAASAPPEIDIAGVLADASELADAAHTAAHGPALRLLAAMAPITPPLDRIHLLAHMAFAAGAVRDGQRTAWLWDAAAAELETGASPRILVWQPATGRRMTYVDTDLVEDLPRRGDIVALAGVLAALAALDPPSRTALALRDAERAAAWLAAGLPVARVADTVIAMRDLDGELATDVARAIRALAGDDLPALVDQARQLFAALAAAKLEYLERRGLMTLALHAARGDAGWLIRAALASADAEPAALHTLADAALLLPVLPRGRWPALVTPPAAAPWIARYPAALAPALAKLAAVTDDAEAAAARRLATDLPDPADLRREIAALRARVDPPVGLARRLATLERRLAEPPALSPARLAHLADKLARAAVAIGLERFLARLTETALGRLGPAVARGGWPVALDRRGRQILVGLARLDEPDRALAARLLELRRGPPPWDLRGDAANAGFLAGLRAAGVDPAPWLDSVPVTVTAGDGRPLTLALCGDPLEVLAMGAHFATCLAPDGANFFSTLANAADLNKRVLYARRGDAVVGRCLLALTDHHAIVTFHPYCHDGAPGFPALVAAFAGELAARMHTMVVPRGSVRVLVARDWYDDGARDLVGRFGGLDDRALGLDDIAPGELAGRLRTALGHELDDITLPLVLGLGAIRRRPALAEALAPFVLAARAPATRIAAATLACDAGNLGLADRLLGEHAGAIALDGWWPTGRMLALLRPQRALAVLRTTRARGVRSWRDEPGHRVAVAAVALEALHRPRKAAELYRLAIAQEHYLADELRDRLAALGD